MTSSEQGAASGQVAIEGNELTLEDYPDTGTEPSVEREVNLDGEHHGDLLL